MFNIKEFTESILLIHAILQHSLFFIILFIYLFLAVLSLCCVTRFSPLVAIGGYSLVAVNELHIAVASLVAEHRFWHVWSQQLWLPGSRPQAQQLWHIGLLFYSMWDLPRSGIKPMSPALADQFLTTGPPEKSYSVVF